MRRQCISESLIPTGFVETTVVVLIERERKVGGAPVMYGALRVKRAPRPLHHVTLNPQRY